MTLFAVVSLIYKEELATTIDQKYSGKSFKVGPGHWLITTEGTAESVSKNLGLVPNGNVGQAIVYNVAGYYGLAPTNLWEWLKTSGSSVGG